MRDNVNHIENNISLSQTRVSKLLNLYELNVNVNKHENITRTLIFDHSFVTRRYKEFYLFEKFRTKYISVYLYLSVTVTFASIAGILWTC